MKLKSVSGLTFYVADLDKTAAFYESLGFIPNGRTETTVSFRLNWFTVDFVAADSETKEDFLAEAKATPRGSGVFISCSVDDVDDTYQTVTGLGYQPSSEPRDMPWGNREFVLRDPDGYKLVFFQKN